MRIALTLERRGGLKLYLPIVPIEVEGLGGFDALIDTGSDITIFPAGVDDKKAIDGVTGTGTGAADLMPTTETMTIRQDGQQLRWTDKVWFSEKERCVLGYKGFIEYFTITIDDINQEVVFTQNRNFPGDVTKDLNWDETIN